MSHDRLLARGRLDSLLIKSPRWAEDGAGHPAPADKSLPRHPVRRGQSDKESHRRGTAGTTLSSRSRTSQPQTHSQTRRGLPGGRRREPPSCEGLDAYPGSDAPDAAHPRSAGISPGSHRRL